MQQPSQIWPDDFQARYRAKGYWKDESFGALIDRLSHEFAERTALVAGAQRLSYADLGNAARRIGAGLRALGLEPGERVLIQMPNRAEFILAALGAFYAGLIPVYALAAHRETEVLHLAAKSGARALMMADKHEGFDYRPLAHKAKATLPVLTIAIVAGEAEDGLIAFDSLLNSTPMSAPEPRDPSSVAFLQISGGSTGLPKLIPRTHNDYIYSFTASAPICGLTADSVYMVALPAAHNFPMSSPGFWGAFSVGAKVVLSPSPAPDTAFKLIESERVTSLGLVPPLALLWLQAAPNSGYDLSSLQVLQVGGAKLMPEVAARIKPVLGCTLQQVFGMAEGLVNYTRLDDPDEIILHTQGRPISPDDEVLILDDAGNPTPEGEAGHIYTRGPYTIRGYYDEPAANERSFTADGFYRTGDIVRRVNGAYLEVRGRAGDHINRAGEKISAEEIEDHLLAHPDVFDACVVGTPDPFLGERSCAFVVLQPQAELKAPALKAFVRARNIAEFKVPDRIIMVPNFETTAVGKISRKALRALLIERYLDPKSQA